MPDSGTRTTEASWVLPAGLWALLAGVVTAVAVTTLGPQPAGWRGAFALVIFMLAAMAISAIIGFIFGVPRTRASGTDEEHEAKPPDASRSSRFEPNSNLEQISDWLTKILVGAGLVQLAALPDAIRGLGDYIEGSLGAC